MNRVALPAFFLGEPLLILADNTVEQNLLVHLLLLRYILVLSEPSSPNEVTLFLWRRFHMATLIVFVPLSLLQRVLL